MTETASIETSTLDKRRWWRNALLLCLLQVLIGLVFIETVPRFYGDEAWEASLGYNLAFNGSLRHGIIEGWGGMHIQFVQNQIIQPLACAGMYKILGFSIFAGRLASLLISALAILGIFASMRRLFSRRIIATLITIGVIFNPWFFQASRRIRPEIFYIAFAMLGMWALIIAAQTGSRKHAFLAGLLAAMAGLSHPTGLVLFFCIALGLLIWQRPPRSGRLIILAVLGLLIGVLPYIIYVFQACQHPEVVFLDQMRGGKAVVKNSLLALGRGELWRWGRYFQWPKGAPLAAIILASMVAGWFRSSKADKFAATVICLMAILLPFTTVNYTAVYLISLTPFISALLVRLIQRLAGGWQFSMRRLLAPRKLLAMGIACVYLLFCFGGIALMMLKLHDANANRLTSRIAQTTGPEKRVYGNIILGAGHGLFNYGPFPLDKDWNQTIQSVKAHRFDYAVRLAWDFQASYGISAPPMKMPEFRDKTIDRVCKHFGQKVDEFRDPFYGPVEIYKLDWTAPASGDHEILDKLTKP